MPHKTIILEMDEPEHRLLLELLFREGAARDAAQEGQKRVECSRLITRMLRALVLASR